MNLSFPVLQAIFDNKELKSPTPLQKQSIPYVIQRQNLIYEAPNKTGKVLGFLGGALTICDEKIKQPQVLVLSFNADHCIKILTFFKEFNKYTQFTYGIALINEHLEPKTQPNSQFIFGTPDSIVLQLKRGRWPSHNVKLIIIDDAEQIISNNFNYLKFLFGPNSNVPSDAQVVLFSSVFPRTLVSKFKKLTPLKTFVEIFLTMDKPIISKPPRKHFRLSFWILFLCFMLILTAALMLWIMLKQTKFT